MRKLIMVATALILAVSLAACGRRNKPNETTAPTVPSTQEMTMPTMPDMTMPSTNIPDPTVDSHSGSAFEESTEPSQRRVPRHFNGIHAK